ncbi:type IV toxin-antitoxin system AbiEi family antitoxin domain-containing protein [Arcanobacterium pinnipediorum]|uniref:Type IV toxin-antitoxin system AbiEi family antitoxin domain-containing protein n=1 Tax=Arcanobacterium pinnipediorum TaxID=1503041 RepID=A0ABY5AFM0_9ACTO|nr:type IV toxin-antitoxin system AbiEi family antitoxin domain-containing protein [Arcanobacterium pinnipediorum]USR79007.1 type IV toxin-antitoxin system AbiEi family antitoxin domain-containing protein [Arcanobacterium pinnipediorum]
MAELYQKWYSSAMAVYGELYEIAVDKHYLVTTEDAADLGIPVVELAKLAHRGKLEHISRGLYRLSQYVPSETDSYAIAVARFGRGAYLYGESVIAMLGLAPTNPDYICVAVPKRTRRSLPDSIRVYRVQADDEVTVYEGVPAQTVVAAIKSARTTMMDERLQEAAETAHQQGYITTSAFQVLKGEMGW